MQTCASLRGEGGFGYSGHVGIVFYHGRTISASSVTNRIVLNDWGFRSGQNTTFRRYVGFKFKLLNNEKDVNNMLNSNIIINNLFLFIYAFK